MTPAGPDQTDLWCYRTRVEAGQHREAASHAQLTNANPVCGGGRYLERGRLAACLVWRSACCSQWPISGHECGGDGAHLLLVSAPGSLLQASSWPWPRCLPRCASSAQPSLSLLPVTESMIHGDTFCWAGLYVQMQQTGVLGCFKGFSWDSFNRYLHCMYGTLDPDSWGRCNCASMTTLMMRTA